MLLGSTGPETAAEAAPDAASAGGSAGRTEPIALPYRAPDPGGTAYRLVFETSGERQLSLSTDLEARSPLHESHLLELEYRELPLEAAGAGGQAYQLVLDGLHYRLLQRNPAADREIEVGNDRLRVRADGDIALDLRGAQPKEDVTPRTLLGRIFGIVVHDAVGNPLRIQSRGTPGARRFLQVLPVSSAVGYSRLAFPADGVAAGTTWRSRRFPASPAGGVGLALDLEYTLAGVRPWDGVPCAWILLRAREDGKDVPSAAGFAFDRVAASLDGEAFVELATSRLRRLVLADEIRAAYSRGAEPGPVSTHRLRHQSRLVLELRDPDASPDDWQDGSERFGSR